MALTSILGYGSFHVADFRPGETFCRFDGTLARIARWQPLIPGSRIRVWQAEELLRIHPTALAYAIDPEQAAKVRIRRTYRAATQ